MAVGDAIDGWNKPNDSAHVSTLFTASSLDEMRNVRSKGPWYERVIEKILEGEWG
jgi:hypothetical protein